MTLQNLVNGGMYGGAPAYGGMRPLQGSMYGAANAMGAGMGYGSGFGPPRGNMMQAAQMMGSGPQFQGPDQAAAAAQQMGRPAGAGPSVDLNAIGAIGGPASGPASPAEQAAYENSPALAAARSWASGFGQQVMPGVYGAGAMAPQQGAPQQQGGPDPRMMAMQRARMQMGGYGMPRSLSQMAYGRGYY